MKLSRTIWLNVSIAALISVAVLIVCYVFENSSLPRPDELKVLRRIDRWKQVSGQGGDNIPDSLLFVNVCFDKQLVDYYEDGFPVGQYVITDRGKLLQFLTIASQSDAYRYIMLDVFFEQGLSSGSDSALFSLIASMPRLVVATHENATLQDSIIASKCALADYTTTFKMSKFSRFQYLHGSQQTMPLRMYEDLHGSTIKKHGLIYSDNGHLCHNALTLKMPIRMTGTYMDSDTLLREKNYLYLGADMLAADSIVPVADMIRNKIVVVGDYANDRHETYTGSQPGSVICMNAYNAICRHDHYARWWFVLFLFVLYGSIAFLRMRGFVMTKFIRWMPLRVVAQLFSVPTLFLVVSFLAYFCGIVYNFYIPALIYWAIDALVNLISKQRETS